MCANRGRGKRYILEVAYFSLGNQNVPCIPLLNRMLRYICTSTFLHNLTITVYYVVTYIIIMYICICIYMYKL